MNHCERSRSSAVHLQHKLFCIALPVLELNYHGFGKLSTDEV